MRLAALPLLAVLVLAADRARWMQVRRVTSPASLPRRAPGRRRPTRRSASRSASLVRSGVDALSDYIDRRRHQRRAGRDRGRGRFAAPIGTARAWEIRHTIPIGNQHGLAPAGPRVHDAARDLPRDRVYHRRRQRPRLADDDPVPRRHRLTLVHRRTRRPALAATSKARRGSLPGALSDRTIPFSPMLLQQPIRRLTEASTKPRNCWRSAQLVELAGRGMRQLVDHNHLVRDPPLRHLARIDRQQGSACRWSAPASAPRSTADARPSVGAWLRPPPPRPRRDARPRYFRAGSS